MPIMGRGDTLVPLGNYIASYSPDAANAIAHELKRAGRRLITEMVRIRYEVFLIWCRASTWIS